MGSYTQVSKRLGGCLFFEIHLQLVCYLVQLILRFYNLVPLLSIQVEYLLCYTRCQVILYHVILHWSFS